MRFQGLDLNLLTQLDALLQHQNVTRAAEHLFISQSAMSNALARLREHFDDKLLLQVGRRMVLTPLAMALAPRLREILAETTQLLETRSSFDPRTSERKFTLCSSDYVWAVLVTEVLKELAVAAPAVQIHYGGPTTRFEKNDIDLLIVPERFAVERLPRETLFTESYVCIVWTDNPLVRERLSQEQFRSLSHIVAYSERRTYIEEWFYQQFGDSLKVAAVTPSYTLVPASVVGTRHLAVVPLRLARQSAERLKLRVLKPPFDIPHMTDVLQWKSYQTEDPGLVWFRNLVKAAARRVFATL